MLYYPSIRRYIYHIYSIFYFVRLIYSIIYVLHS